jgi:hypothetical protein
LSFTSFSFATNAKYGGYLLGSGIEGHSCGFFEDKRESRDLSTPTAAVGPFHSPTKFRKNDYVTAVA